jgi:DNA-binding GntR family transcriptional regulator
VPVPNSHDGSRLAHQAYEFLRSAILEGRLPPGTPLSRRRLAEELGMSPVPVGDAITRLEGEGLIESRPRAGTRVRLATAEEIHGNYVLREALETHSARLFAESASPRFRKRLEAAAKKLDAAYEALSRGRRYSPVKHARAERVHIAFHMLIAEATGVPLLIHEIERSRVLLFNWMFTVSSEFGTFPERWHRDLAERLVHGSPREAAEAMRMHVRFRQEDVIKKFRALAESGSGEQRMIRGPQRRNLAAGRIAGVLL